MNRDHAKRALDFLADMIRFKSYSGTPGEGELARFVVEQMQRLGLEAFTQEVEPGRMNAIGIWRGTGGGKSLLFNGHLDTNPVTEGWTVDPWGGVYDDRFVYGIGVSNMKAGDAASFCAVERLIEGGVRLRGDVGVVHGALSRELHEWRPPQVADFARLVGTARYAPSQSEASVLADLRRLLDEVERETPGLRATVARSALGNRPVMLPFEVPRDARIVEVVRKAHRAVRGAEQPLGPVPPYCFYGTDAAHLLHRAHMEGVVCGPGGRYNTMPDERVDVADYLDMVEIYMLAIQEICR